MNVKSYLKKLTADRFVSAFALFCIGICCIIWAEQVIDAIVVVLGVVALVFAATNLIKFLRAAPGSRTTLSLFVVLMSFVFGLMLVFRTSLVKDAISFFVGLYIILTSAVNLMDLLSLSRRVSLNPSAFLWPVLGLLVGFLCVSGQFVVPDQLARLTGFVLVIYSVVTIFGLLSVSSFLKTAEIQEAVVVEPSSKSSKFKKSSKASKSSKKSSSSKSSKNSKK